MKTEILKPNEHVLFRGVGGLTKRKYNNKLVKTDSEYNTIYFTNNYNYASAYANSNDNGMNNGSVTEWTPTRPLKILVLNSIVLKEIKKSIKNNTLPNKVINESIGKSYLTRKGHTVENLKKGLRPRIMHIQGKPTQQSKKETMYNSYKSIVPQNIIYEKNKMSKKWENARKLLDNIMQNKINVKSLNDNQIQTLSYLNLFHEHNINKLKGGKGRFNRSYIHNYFPLIKLNNNNKGFSRVSNASHDTYLYYYIMKYIKQQGYDGIKTITKGISRNNGSNTRGNVEYVFSAKGINTLFKRVDEIPELRYNLLNYMNEYNIKGLKGR